MRHLSEGNRANDVVLADQFLMYKRWQQTMYVGKEENYVLNKSQNLESCQLLTNYLHNMTWSDLIQLLKIHVLNLYNLL